jgi:hypothetical protein
MSAFGKKDFDLRHALALRDGSDWHVTSFAALQYFGRFRGRSGQWAELALNWSVANDPKRTSAPTLINFLLKALQCALGEKQ